VAPGSRILACAAGVLAFAAPAFAANGDAPGTLNKQTTAPEQAPAPAPAHTTPAPVPTTKATPKAAPETKSTPVNKGTVKKLVPTQTAATPAAGSTTTTGAVRRSATRRRPAQSASAAQRAARRRHGAARGRPHGVPVRAHGTAGAPGQQIAAGAPLTAPGRANTTAAKSAAAAPQAHETKGDKTNDPAPLTSLSRTADHVIEVIPGTVILALAGLTALVLILILRSLAVERQRGKALAMSYGVTVEALASAIEAKDLTTGGHIERVRRLGLLLAAEIIPRDSRDPQLAYGFLLHDIGKLAVPDAILRAPGRLSEEQWTLMRQHPEEGVRMLANVPFLDRALDVVRHHHERWDGGGYPDGLKGDEIPLWARIFSVVDALDAITAERPYRAARSYDSALQEIRRHSGTQFDPAVVEALVALGPAVVEPLLEPAQQVEPLTELPQVVPLVAV
jgi:ribonuclease P protein subunit RPR2